MRILFVGERNYRSAPLATISRALATVHCECRFSDGAELGPPKSWMKLVRESDVIVTVTYTGPKVRMLQNLARAVIAGVPVVRFWAGSDVLYLTTRDNVLTKAQALDRLVTLNLAAADHLVTELANVGLNAITSPGLVDDFVNVVASPFSHSNSLLVYLPTARKDFYGKPIVEQAIVENPDLRFVIVGDEEHSLGHHQNVVSLGWVDDMSQVWPEVGGLIRITEHDGLPRMVLECLARGKYAIYSWPLPGCWLAKSTDQLRAQLLRFRQQTSLNTDGIAAANSILPHDGPMRFKETLQGVLKFSAAPPRFFAMWRAVDFIYRNWILNRNKKRKSEKAA